MRHRRAEQATQQGIEASAREKSEREERERERETYTNV